MLFCAGVPACCPRSYRSLSEPHDRPHQRPRAATGSAFPGGRTLAAWTTWGLAATVVGGHGRRRLRHAHRALADDFKCFILDCDGVLWRGGEAIPGSREAVQSLQRSGKGLAFVTNASARTRAAVAGRIGGMIGLDVAQEDVITSASVAAAALRARGCKTSFVVGAKGLCEELLDAGVEVVDPTLPEKFDEAEFRELVSELSGVDSVVIGHDEAFTYGKLALASFFIQQGGEACAFIGTNPDVGNRDAAGYLLPEAGALIAAVEAVTSRKALVVGKPSPELIRQLLLERGLQAEEVLVVGDRLDTDIRFGLAGNTKTCLVLTGVCTEAEATQLPKQLQPHFIKPCLRDVVID